MHETYCIMKWSMELSSILPCCVSVPLPYSLSVKKDFPNHFLLNQDISNVTTVTKTFFLVTALGLLASYELETSRIELFRKSSPRVAVLCFLSQLPVSSPFLKVIRQLLNSSSSSCRPWPVHLTFPRVTVCRLPLCSLALCDSVSFYTRSVEQVYEIFCECKIRCFILKEEHTNGIYRVFSDLWTSLQEVIS